MKLLDHTADKVTLELTRHELHLANADPGGAYLASVRLAIWPGAVEWD